MTTPKGMGGQVVYTQDDRQALLSHMEARSYRKTARIFAVQQDKPFMVYTEHGPLPGVPGDWLATNHPDDDPGSDIWVISAERMKNTYEPTGVPHPGENHKFETQCKACGDYGTLFVAILGPTEKATISDI